MLPCRIDGIRQLTLRLDKAITGRCQLITDVNQRHPDPAGTKAAILTMRRLRLKKFGAHQCKTSGRTSRTTDIILLRLIRCGTTLTRTTTGRRCRRRRTCMRTHGTHLHRIRAFSLTRRQIRASLTAVSSMCRILGGASRTGRTEDGVRQCIDENRKKRTVKESVVDLCERNSELHDYKSRPSAARFKRFCSVQRLVEPTLEHVHVFQPDRHPNQVLFHAPLQRPVELGPMREHGVRARQSKVGAERGALLALESIVKDFGSGERGKDEAEQATVPVGGAVFVCRSEAGSVVFGRDEFRVKDGFEDALVVRVVVV